MVASRGTRIVGIRVVSATRKSQRLLDVVVDRVGDFSPYTLSLRAAQVDPLFASTEFSFRASCQRIRGVNYEAG